ncbi:MAG: tetratricopeptide repeat protein [Desulfobacteraceae bacterium]|nr:tetratricopeptide repeat protein [Desulfobacteraceae bacterium]
MSKITGKPLQETVLPVLRRTAVPVMLAVLVVAVYAPVRHHGFSLFDDPDYVTENPRVRSGLSIENLRWAMTAFVAGNWHPVTMVSHMMDVELFGLQAGYHHGIHVLLHLLNCLILYAVLTRMTGSPVPAAMAAAWFGVHPIHVESVAWIAERKDVLSGFFWMLSLLCYHRYTQRPGLRSYVLLVAVFALGLMAKPMLVTFPLVLLLLDHWPLERSGRQPAAVGQGSTSAVRLLLEKLPLLLLSAVSAVTTWIAQKQAGAVAGYAVLPLEERLANAVHSYCRYLQNLFWPTDLAVFYPLPDRFSLSRMNLEGVLLIGLCLGAFFWGRRHRYLAVGWLWFLITLLPVIGLVQVGAQAMADRYAYLPFIGLYVAGSWSLWEAIAGRKRRLAIGIGAFLVSTALLAGAARHQVSIWRSDIVLFSHAVSVTHKNDRMLNNLGLAYAAAGEVDKAISCYRKALGIDPRYADARLNLGNAYLRQGDVKKALTQFQQVLRHAPDNDKALYNIAVARMKAGDIDAALGSVQALLRKRPDFPKAHNLLGDIEMGRNRVDAALSHYRRAVDIDPLFAEARYNLAVTLEKMGKVDAAIHHYRRVLSTHPEMAEAHLNLGGIWFRRGRPDQALQHYLAAMRSRPLWPQAYFNIGAVLMQKGQGREAVAWYQRAVLLDGENLVYRRGLADALLRIGRSEAAVDQYQEILQRSPRSVSAHSGLASALAATGRKEEALQQYRTALELDAEAPQVHNEMGVLLIRLGRIEEGIEHLKKALHLKPGDSRFRKNLEAAQQRLQEAGRSSSSGSARAVKPDAPVQ